ncbi:cysteine synthase A [Aristophania vespae]|uniref:cysteine synthase A n=1 Tax=Aristophania vespae TaxID=2697033 RepID=UPI0023518FD5|nr:cysteine synthase A [Aristophania vespae]UMM64122.1 O-acetylserine sulfhydrylase [Aristophania vespae]
MIDNDFSSNSSYSSIKNLYAPARGRIYNSVLETIGGTPLVALNRLSEKKGLSRPILLKLEFFNPLGSVKDRIGLAMIRQAEAKKIISPHKSVLVEPTSGNTGIALTFAAVALGYKIIVTMPESASLERRKMMTLMGAELELTPASQGMSGAIKRAKEIVESSENAWMPSQFENQANPQIHADTTAEEIWIDTQGSVDVIVAGLGTGGTASGIARALKPRKETLKIFGVEPLESAVINGDDPGPHGIQGIGAGFKPETLDLPLIDKVLTSSEQEAIETSRLCARTEGLPIGISSGAALHAAIELARTGDYGDKDIVVIAPSFAERYLSTNLFNGI